MTEQRKAVIKNADMSENMQQDAVDCASQAMAKYNIEKDVAAYIKREFDKKHGPTWHVIVGRNFGSYVTHETKHFIYFYLGQVAVLLFGVVDTYLTLRKQYTTPETNVNTETQLVSYNGGSLYHSLCEGCDPPEVETA
eukprot:CAMPEP_0116851136 /NCGR_PEP_ID=MMETSP0418-20121206/16542_1 /TAXON_ID=1158023 /ORGANISM="Astrosyne radiata, Strain 13vi08-1A" /LENGTH=137 /DNA_ID=CAMNT_0004483099 /DNA_START=40 /DNA_END=454 /DNA_ORIENTATION=+